MAVNIKFLIKEAKSGLIDAHSSLKELSSSLREYARAYELLGSTNPDSRDVTGWTSEIAEALTKKAKDLLDLSNMCIAIQVDFNNLLSPDLVRKVLTKEALTPTTPDKNQTDKNPSVNGPTVRASVNRDLQEVA